MTHEDTHKIIEIVARWMELREQGGYAPLQDGRTFRMEADHSLRGGLLERLLIHGKEPLQHTPPLHFSRPWYSLIEKGEAVVEDMFVSGGLETDTLSICQHQWHVLRREGDDYLVSWRPDKSGESHWGLWRVTKNSDSWVLSRTEEHFDV